MRIITIDDAVEEIQDEVTLSLNHFPDLARIYSRIFGGDWRADEEKEILILGEESQS